MWFDPARGLGVDALAERLTELILHGQLSEEAVERVRGAEPDETPAQREDVAPAAG
jgi:hypothetical protein